MQTEKAIKELIVNDKVMDAINLLYEQEEDTTLVNELIILKSNLITLNKKIRAGILAYEEESRSLNRIKFDLLNLLPRAGQKSTLNETDAYFSFDQSQFESKISQLTQDQFKVLNFINKINKVRISGCAGSGKTLVAAEKAIRLSGKGLKVLMLCHNPNLARKIKRLVSGSDVYVSAFGQFIHSINQHNTLTAPGWNKYYEPLSEDLGQALKIIEAKPLNFDAVIVDEAQDFREEWWIIVETILATVANPVFYIFHDDNQALLPFRSYYPIEEPIVDLSKNCRNGGKVFDFIKSNFHHQAPETSLEIKDIGRVKLFVYKNNDWLKARVFSAIEWMRNTKHIRNPVVLLAGDLSINSWEFGYVSQAIAIGSGWRKEVIRCLRLFIPDIDLKKLNALTHLELPTDADIELIQTLAEEAFGAIDKDTIYTKLGTQIAKSNRVRWIVKNGKSVLHFEYDDPFTNKFFLLKFLSRPDWTATLRETLTFEFVEQYDIQDEETIPVFETASFKGLESDGVILVTKGQSHSYLNELYVASSRARKILAIVIDKKNENFYIP